MTCRDSTGSKCVEKWRHERSPGTKAKFSAAVAVIILLAGAIATLVVTQISRDPMRERVTEIVRTNNWNYLGDNAELQLLIAIGPKVLDTLSSMVEWRESSLHRRYVKVWPSLPGLLRNHLQDPRIHEEMHRKAVQIVNELGPAAIRPLTSALCNALEDADWQNNTYALRSLYWSIPESSKSVAMLVKWLSDPLHGQLFGSVDCWELYPKLPQTMPLLAACLRNPYLAREAAIGLGMMGSNAVSAVPSLIEVCDDGYAEPPLRANFKISYGSAGE